MILSSVNTKSAAKLCAVIGGATISWSLSGFLSGVASVIAVAVGATHLYDWWQKRKQK